MLFEWVYNMKEIIIIIYNSYIIKILTYAYYSPSSPFLGHKILLCALKAFILQQIVIALDSCKLT